jgi:hypothetical protein
MEEEMNIKYQSFITKDEIQNADDLAAAIKSGPIYAYFNDRPIAKVKIDHSRYEIEGHGDWRRLPIWETTTVELWDAFKKFAEKVSINFK